MVKGREVIILWGFFGGGDSRVSRSFWMESGSLSFGFFFGIDLSFYFCIFGYVRV